MPGAMHILTADPREGYLERRLSTSPLTEVYPALVAVRRPQFRPTADQLEIEGALAPTGSRLTR